ncbi:MAG: FKBP-type peptidyl-prolyl cis-trans isomerase [Deinococcales bacterium]
MNKNLIGAGAGILILAVGGLFILQNSPASPTANPTSSEQGLCANQPAADTSFKNEDVKTLGKQDRVLGTGAEAVAGKTVVVNYIGRLVDGKQFDTSCDRGTPFDFELGAGRVIRGWDEGVAGMKVGGQRRLVIPADLGYGAAGAGAAIPPNAALIFDVELLEVK